MEKDVGMGLCMILLPLTLHSTIPSYIILQMYTSSNLTPFRFAHSHAFSKHYVIIRESVDSLCRDGADTPMPPYIGKAFTGTNVED